jgi:hypothetical protein
MLAPAVSPTFNSSLFGPNENSLPSLHHLLRVDHKWSAERYERWLADMVESLIVPKKG